MDRKDPLDHRAMSAHRVLLALLGRGENLAILDHLDLLACLVFKETRGILAFLEKREQVGF